MHNNGKAMSTRPQGTTIGQAELVDGRRLFPIR